MSLLTLKVPRKSDARVAKIFHELAAKYDASSGTVTYSGRSIPASINFAAEPNGEWKTLLEQQADLIQRAHFTIQGISITYHRGGNNESDPSPIFDVVIIDKASSAEPPWGTVIFVLGDLHKQFEPFQPDRHVGGASFVELNQLAAIQDSKLDRLADLASELTIKQVERASELERIHAGRMAEDDKLIRQKESELKSDYEQKQSQLKLRSDELDLRQKAIDDRGNTHARRAIRDSLSQEVKARILTFDLSQSTRRKRLPVSFGLLGAAICLSGLLVWLIYDKSNRESREASFRLTIEGSASNNVETLKQFQLNSSAERLNLMRRLDQDSTNEFKTDIRYVPDFLEVQDRTLNSVTNTMGASDRQLQALMTNVFKYQQIEVVVSIIKISITTIALFSTIFFYVKWENSWATEHARNEIELQKFRLDVDRANWVVESCLEWFRETKQTVPPELLASLTQGLFSGERTPGKEPAISPADSLASALLGSASKVNLKAGENTIEFNKPSKI